MSYTCGVCGVRHDERPRCFGADLPAAVAALPDAELESRVERSSDQCILDGEHFFILGNLELPVHGSREPLAWTVWTSLNAINFERASRLWDTPGRESEPPYFGWLSNQIPGYPPCINIEVVVHTEPVGVRPRLQIIEDGHQLAVDQERGISPERADELIDAALHDGEVWGGQAS